MGTCGTTRALIHIKDGGKDSETLVTICNQFDGYPDVLGLNLYFMLQDEGGELEEVTKAEAYKHFKSYSKGKAADSDETLTMIRKLESLGYTVTKNEVGDE